MLGLSAQPKRWIEVTVLALFFVKRAFLTRLGVQIMFSFCSQPGQLQLPAQGPVPTGRNC